MPKPEIKGQQIRIRVKDPSKYTKFGTQDVGKTGKLQRVAGYKDGKWETQAFRVNLGDYSKLEDVKKDIMSIREISPEKKAQAIKLATVYIKKQGE